MHFETILRNVTVVFYFNFCSRDHVPHHIVSLDREYYNYFTCTDLVASGWFFQYSYLYTVMITIYLGGRLAFGGRGSFYPSNTIDGTLPTHVLKCFPLLQKPFRSKSDQHQFSPNNISRSTRVKVMRITKLMTKGRILWSQTKFSQLFLKEMYGEQSGEFLCGFWLPTIDRLTVVHSVTD